MPGPKPARLKCGSAGDHRLARGAATEDADEGCGPIVRVLVVDDDPVTLHLVSHFLRNLGHQVDVAVDGLAALRMFQQHRFPVVITDWEMPGLNGLEATRRILQTSPHIAVLIVTMFDDDSVFAAMQAGARGYLLKDAEPEELAKAVRAAARGESPLDPRAGRALLQARSGGSPLDSLSDREREVLAMVARGLPNKLIARELAISEKTVKTHLTSVFRTIGVSDRTQAALWAERNGLGPGGS